MKILFVYPNITKQATPQVGIASLLPYLYKHQVCFFDLTNIAPGNELTSYLETLRSFSPDVVMFSCRTNEWGYVRRLLEITYPIPTVVGGIHPTVSPDEVLAYATMIIRGEGEGAMEDVVSGLESGKDLSATPNVWLKRGGKVYKNDVRPLIQDLDSLPLPMWGAFNERHFFGSYIRSLFKEIECVGTFETTRGCPFSCTYCCNYYLHKLYAEKGKYHRRKTPQRVAREIQEFKKLYPETNFLYFVDDTFMVDIRWLEKFAGLYDKTPFVFMTRAEMVTKDKMKLIAEMGGKAVSIGIENGNEQFRKKVLDRQMSDEQIISAFKTAKDFGLHTYSFNMVGLPYETPRDIQLTIKLNKQIKPDIAQFTTFYPLPGTRLFDICKQEGYFTDYPETFSYYDKSFLKMPNLKAEEIDEWVKKATKECNPN